MFCKALLDDGATRVFTVSEELTVAAAALKFTNHDIGSLMVVDGGGALIGIFTERDLARAVSQHGVAALTMSIEGFMTGPVATCEPDDALDHLMDLMKERHIRYIPVVEDGRPIGMVSACDVVARLRSGAVQDADATGYPVSGRC